MTCGFAIACNFLNQLQLKQIKQHFTHRLSLVDKIQTSDVCLCRSPGFWKLQLIKMRTVVSICGMKGEGLKLCAITHKVRNLVNLMCNHTCAFIHCSINTWQENKEQVSTFLFSPSHYCSTTRTNTHALTFWMILQPSSQMISH